MNLISNFSLIKDYENRHTKNNRASGDPQQIVKAAANENSKTTRNVETSSINSATTPVRESPESPAMT